MSKLVKATNLFEEHAGELSHYLVHDERGKQIPRYLTVLSRHLMDEQSQLLDEVDSLIKKIDHIKEIVATQQQYAGQTGVLQEVSIKELIEDALQMSAGSITQFRINVVRDYGNIDEVQVDKHRTMQVIVNLIRNAIDSLSEANPPYPELSLKYSLSAESLLSISVSDNGLGISEDILTRIFAHGFTTKKHGHGFGLHSSSLAASEMGGSLAVDSAGLGTGATFTLEFPV